MREWIVGRNPVYEVLRARRRHAFRLWLAEGIQKQDRLLEIIEQAKAIKIPVEWLPRVKLDALNEHHQGVALEASGYPYRSLDEILAVAKQRSEPPFILILDLLQNPQNLGSLLRTAEAMGVHGVLMPLRRAAEITPAVVNASAGASEHLTIAQANLAQAMETLKQNDIWIIGLEDTPQAQPPEKVRLDGAVALVVGNEGEGMRTLVRKSCDLLMRLPMKGKIDSLNAAAAGSIALYLVARARTAQS